MIYWYTGQPGHGKTLHAIDHAIDFKKQGRLVYVCNVRDFDYDKAGMLEMTPQQFHNWMDFLPDGAVALVDEAYEHGMLPKRAPGSRCPPHVEQLAKHRHRGIDFIFVSQSPDKQCDSFTHDLIDRHVHVRRLFGTGFVNLRTFDRFEANAERATPITVKRVRLPKRPMGLYKSTEMDTTERRIPWYFYAFAVGIPFTLFVGWYEMSHLEKKFVGDAKASSSLQGQAAVPGVNGASATVAPGASAPPVVKDRNYAELMSPRIDGQPWTAPAFDSVPFMRKPPRVFCASSGYDGSDSCSCITDQGTRYLVALDRCRVIARFGQLDPFYDVDDHERNRLDGIEQSNRIRDDLVVGREAAVALPVHSSAGATDSSFARVAKYGDHALAPPGTLSIGDE